MQLPGKKEAENIVNNNMKRYIDEREKGKAMELTHVINYIKKRVENGYTDGYLLTRVDTYDVRYNMSACKEFAAIIRKNAGYTARCGYGSNDEGAYPSKPVLLYFTTPAYKGFFSRMLNLFRSDK